MKLQIIVGSSRPGRVSDKVAEWTAAAAKTIDGTEVEIVDLADHVLPLFDEAGSPQYNPERKPNAPAQKFLDKLAEADAYAIVTPEYNRSTSGVLKNALDYVDFQMKQKPVLIIGHGTTGGAQAVDSLRSILPAFKGVTIPSVVYVMGHATASMNEDGELTDEDIKNNPYGPQAALHNALDELKWYSDALAAARG
jgi:NAD(P)H-dependent FMN reductase